MTKKIVRYRSAVDGRFVKEGYANRFPDKTIKDTMKMSGKGKPR